MRFAVYSRKSVYTGRGESVENQVEMCREYIFSKFDGATDGDITVYEDEGFSGKNTDRPRFQQMLKDIRHKAFDYVVCYRLDRISRNVSDFSALIEELNAREISFICIKEEFDTSKPMGKAMMYIASVFAQLERETIAERVRDNMLMLARTGRWLGGTTPTGLTSEKMSEVIIDGKVKTSCKLKWDPEEIRVVRLMFEKFLELRSLSGVGKYLIGQGIRSRMGKYYSLLGIREILQNPVYCVADKDVRDYFVSLGSEVCFEETECSEKYGLLSYNKRDYTKRHAPRQPVERWIIAVGRHKGIVHGKQWITVQNLLERNKPESGAVREHNDYSLLSGVIRCTKCGSRMFAKARNNRHKLYDYICQSKLRGGTKLCDCPNLNGRQTDDTVCEYLMQYTKESSDLFRSLEQLKNDLQKDDRQDPIDEIDVRIAKCNHEMDNLIETLAQNQAGGAFVQRVNRRVTELDSKLQQLTAEKKTLEKTAQVGTEKEIQLDLMVSALSSLKDHFKDLTIQEKRMIIQLLVQKIEWNGEDLHIFIYGE